MTRAVVVAGPKVRRCRFSFPTNSVPPGLFSQLQVHVYRECMEMLVPRSRNVALLQAIHPLRTEPVAAVGIEKVLVIVRQDQHHHQPHQPQPAPSHEPPQQHPAGASEAGAVVDVIAWYTDGDDGGDGGASDGDCDGSAPPQATPTDVNTLLQILDLEQYGDALAKEGYDNLGDLQDAKTEDLMEAGMKRPHAKRIARHFEDAKNSTNTSGSSASAGDSGYGSTSTAASSSASLLRSWPVFRLVVKGVRELARARPGQVVRQTAPCPRCVERSDGGSGAGTCEGAVVTQPSELWAATPMATEPCCASGARRTSRCTS
jgi:hypothetical protein